MLKSTLLIIVLFFSLRFCFAQEEAGLESKDYTIASNDILEITVYGESDLSTTARVAQDGTISYPLLGNIKVEGRSVRELEKHITSLLSEDYLVNPQVKVFMKQYSTFSILGETKIPGSFQMKEGLTLTQVIAQCGGFTDVADQSKLKVVRTAGGVKETLDVDFEQIMKRSLPDIEIMANDVILVQPYGQFSIIGQVVKPGVYNLRKNITVVEAIGLAGGFTPTAAQNGTKLIREEDGKRISIRVAVGSVMASGDKERDVSIQEGDTIVVPESFF